ncbi:MAG TPA: pyridoxamine 5'-phosphate oxidase family protein [Pyrinomonadaceae bacterium]|jgi:nitroimidazol reductase NimA-like FMN-containing flavoprotein (pyridoxamine 5'-phosphate oxidase superfamily)
MNEYIEQTKRTKLKRLPKRGHFERETVYRILDEALVCHVGFCADNQPFVIPTSYARIGDRLVIHGSAASRMMRSLSEEIYVCVTVTLIDGLVLARSAFHHSMNYRSVVVFGKARVITDEREKYEALEAFTEHIVPNRWESIRPPSKNELKGTTVLSLDITEASAKIRAGGPVDDEEDYELDAWAGVLPIELTTGAPLPDERLKNGTEIPPDVLNYNRKR